MQTENGAAAPSDGQAAQSEPAESEQATSQTSVPEGEAAAENAETQGTEQESKPEGDEQEETPKTLSRYQRLARTKARLATMVAEQGAELEELRKKVSGSGIASDAPKATDYAQGEYDPGYLTDLAAHKAAQKIGKQLDEQNQRAVTEKITLAKEEAAEEFLERADELKTSIPDFDAAFEAFQKQGGTFAPHVIEELHESEKGPLLAYQLAKNPQLVNQLNRMSPRDAAREIGRLEAKASLPQQRKQTQASAPIKPLAAGGSTPTKTVYDLANSDDLSAYMKARNAEEQAKGRR
jgi:hypothetical protein